MGREARRIPVLRDFGYLASEELLLKCAGSDQAASGDQLHFLVGLVVPVGRGQFNFFLLYRCWRFISLCLLFSCRLQCVGVVLLFQPIYMNNLLLVVLIDYFIVQVGKFSSYPERSRQNFVKFSEQTRFNFTTKQVNQVPGVEFSQFDLTLYNLSFISCMSCWLASSFCSLVLGWV